MVSEKDRARLRHASRESFTGYVGGKAIDADVRPSATQGLVSIQTYLTGDMR